MDQSQNGFVPQQLPPVSQPHQQPSQPQKRPAARPNSKSGFSFHSHKSHDSSGSAPKFDLNETAKEKAARRLSTKADPRLAMSEAEPSAVASDHSSSLAPLRAIQHRDINGIPIADPDRSNPTRSRWERPLDTIRSFEAAIDGNYSRKASGRPDQTPSRRTSYYAGSTVGTVKPYQGNGYGRNQHYQNDGYANGRGSAMASRPDSYYENNYNNNGYFPNRQRHPRTPFEPMSNNNSGVYPPNGNPQSYETVTTASGSGSSGEALGYSTDPSSENSSFDRIPAASRQEYNEGYNGYLQPLSNVQTKDGYAHGGHPSQLSQQYGAGGASQGYQSNGYLPQKKSSPPPNTENVPPRVPIKLGKSAGGPAQNSTPEPVQEKEKRKGWFSKRFSRA